MAVRYRPAEPGPEKGPEKAKPAAVPQARKVAISIRLDADIVERFKATGPGWQTRMNDALKSWRPK
jgi:uncharacterized protein (DUF4415 family)